MLIERIDNVDRLEVQVEVNEAIFFDEMKKQREFVLNVEKRLANALGIGAKVKLVEPSTILRSEGKAERVIDRRQL